MKLNMVYRNWHILRKLDL